MRYSQTHKDETHARLVTIAGQVLRKAGPDKLSVAEVMKEAGLTHGGFYAHFKSKDAFIAEALETIFAQSRARMVRQIEGLPPRHALATFIDSYMSRRHRDNPEQGCPITALNSDLPRQSKAVRAVFDAGTKRLIEWVGDLIARSGFEGDADALAPSILSAMAGAVAVSRAVSDKSLSDEMLGTARTGIKARLGVDDAALSRSGLQ